MYGIGHIIEVGMIDPRMQRRSRVLAVDLTVTCPVLFSLASDTGRYLDKGLKRQLW